MTFADLMAMRRVSDPQVSPSGKWVMFSVTDVSLEKNTKVNHLWVVGLGGSGAGEVSNPTIGAGQPAPIMGHPVSAGERQVTFGDGEENGRFSPDGRWVSFTAKDQIYLAAWDEAAGGVGAARQLTRVEGAADGAVWSPDSRRLMFVAGVWPECSMKGSDPTRDGRTVTDWAPINGGGTNAEILRSAQNDNGGGFGAVVGGTRDLSGLKGMADPTHGDTAAMNGAPTVAASWAEEDACDKAKDEAVDKSPVKGQVWEGLLYRHWNAYTGAKRSHVLVVSADGSGVRDLTPASAVGDAETPTFSLGGPLGYAWAPDSKEIAYVTNLDAVPAASTNNDVFTLRLDEAGARAVKVSTSSGSDDGPAYSPDGKWLAWRSQARGGFESDKFDLIVMDRSSGSTRSLTTQFDSWVDEFAWAPDSNDLYIASPSEGKELLFEFATTGGKIKEVASTHVGEFTFRCSADFIGCEQAEFGGIQVAPDGKRFVTTRMSVNRPAEIVSMTKVEVDPVNWSRGACAGCWGIVQRDDGRKPWDVATDVGPVLVDLKPLTHLNDSLLRTMDLSLLEHFWFVGAANTKVEGFILRPPGFDAAKKYPVKFLMHGGPQTAWGDAWSYRWNWELMAASGYVVVGINRRGSTGYGQKFVDEVSGDWGGRAYEDLMKGLDYAEAHYSFIDKTRECALGASYGGFMADWVLTHTNRFQCIVTHDGMYDPVAAYGSTEEMWFNEWEFRRPEDFPKGWDGFSAAYDPMGHANPTHAQGARVNGAPAVGGGTKTNTEILTGGEDDGQKRDAGVLRSAQNDNFGRAKDKHESEQQPGPGRPAQPWRYAGLAADEDPFRRWSPMRFIANAKTPTLVIHSQKDYRLDVSQGMELFTALQRLGVPSKMLYFPDEGHWVQKPQNAEVWNEVVGDWCDRWTKTGKWAEGGK